MASTSRALAEVLADLVACTVNSGPGLIAGGHFNVRMRIFPMTSLG